MNLCELYQIRHNNSLYYNKGRLKIIQKEKRCYKTNANKFTEYIKMFTKVDKEFECWNFYG